jgi:hypothetical protein
LTSKIIPESTLVAEVGVHSPFKRIQPDDGSANTGQPPDGFIRIDTPFFSGKSVSTKTSPNSAVGGVNDPLVHMV